MVSQHVSKRIALAVNLAKLTLLAALAPPVIAGIAERASQLGEGIDTAALVALTASLGSLAAIAGALGFGTLADSKTPTLKSRWIWVVIATSVGSCGLVVLATGTSPLALVGGWVFAQLGYSGAMAVLRAILAFSAANHRRRGAVVVVLSGYAGVIIPLAMLLAFPQSLWHTTFGLAVLSLAVPFAFLLVTPKHELATSAPGAQDMDETEGHADASGRGTPVPRGWLLAIQCATNVTITIFLSYHPLELAQRMTENTEFPVRASVMVVTAALVGLLIATSLLLRRPEALIESLQIIALAGGLLASSLVLRALTDSFVVIIGAGLLSGAAVGLTSSALFSSALDAARHHSGGRLMGAYSAAGALGQFVGPLIALGLLNTGLNLVPSDEAGYRTVFLLLALLPLTWAGGAIVWRRKQTKHKKSQTMPGKQSQRV